MTDQERILLNDLNIRVVRLETTQTAHSAQLTTLIEKLEHLDRAIQRATGALLLGAPLLGFAGTLIARALF